jgi:hypothetical protein
MCLAATAPCVCPIQSLSQEQLKDYSLQKASLKKKEEDSSDDSDSEDDSDDDSSADSKDGNSENQQVSKLYNLMQRCQTSPFTL